jgi:hypothetical protein
MAFPVHFLFTVNLQHAACCDVTVVSWEGSFWCYVVVHNGPAMAELLTTTYPPSMMLLPRQASFGRHLLNNCCGDGSAARRRRWSGEGSQHRGCGPRGCWQNNNLRAHATLLWNDASHRRYFALPPSTASTFDLAMVVPRCGFREHGDGLHEVGTRARHHN